MLLFGLFKPGICLRCFDTISSVTEFGHLVWLVKTSASKFLWM